MEETTDTTSTPCLVSKEFVRETLKKYMADHTLTREELAEKLSVSASRVSQVMNGMFSTRTLTKIEKALDVKFQ